MPRIAIIAAMEREVAPLVAGWRVFRDSAAAYRCFVRGNVVVICGGIGTGPASAAAEMARTRHRPDLLVSAGLAGALVERLTVGEIFVPAQVVHSGTGACFQTVSAGSGTLLTVPGVAGVSQKKDLARQYAAQAADMEASAVAAVALRYGISFAAVKAISDEVNFALPEMAPYIAPNGRFRSARFAFQAAVHPASWKSVRQLSLNSRIASQELCTFLRHRIDEGSWAGSVQLKTKPAVGRGENAVHDRAQ